MKLICLTLMAFTSLSSYSAVANKKVIQLLDSPNGSKGQIDRQDVVLLERLDNMFKMDSRSPGLSAMIKRHTFKHKQKAVPILIKVMKDGNYPEQNRWLATMLMGQVMGKKAAPFIAKFSEHPHWMMRVASLKALLGLRQSEYHAVYIKALKDPSLIVRTQALDNISQLQIKAMAPHVWAMMYDQTNYSGDSGNRKRTSIVKSVIRTIGDLKFDKASKPLAKLIQKPKYQDLIEDLDYSLERITGKVSPNSDVNQRRKFWSHLIAQDTRKI